MSRLSAIAVLLFSMVARASVPLELTVQGVLRDGGGTLQSGTVNVTVKFFDAVTAGNAVGSVYGPTALAAVNGLFTNTITLSGGDLIALSGATEVWMEVMAGNDTFPRQRVTPELYALIARQADGLSSSCSGCVSNAMIAGGIDGSKVTGMVPSAAALQSIGVSSTAPTAGQALVYNSGSGKWEPGGVTLAGDVTGGAAANTVSKIQNVAITATGATSGKVMMFNGTGWAPNASPLAIANGGTGSSSQNFVDLSSAQTVAGLKAWTAGGLFGGASSTNSGALVTTGASSGLKMDDQSTSGEGWTITPSGGDLLFGLTDIPNTVARLERSLGQLIVGNPAGAHTTVGQLSIAVDAPLGGTPSVVLTSNDALSSNLAMGSTSSPGILNVTAFGGGLVSILHTKGPIVFDDGAGTGEDLSIASKTVTIDPQNNGNGGLSSYALVFGSNGSEGISSKRSGGGNQNGLDLYTNSIARVRISNAGLVAVGSVAFGPNEPLQVGGSLAAVALAEQNDPTNAAKRFSTYVKGGIFRWFSAGAGGDVMRVTDAGVASKLDNTTTWSAFSDERLKNVIGRYARGLRELMQLEPIRYRFKSDNPLGLPAQRESIGFGAQSVQKVLPEAVSRSDSGYLQVNADPILWTMVNAVKEQQHEIEELRLEIRRLRAQQSETRSSKRRATAQ